MKKFYFILLVIFMPLYLNSWSLFGEEDLKNVKSQNTIAIGKFQLTGKT